MVFISEIIFSRFFGESFLESFTPNFRRRGSFSSLMRYPAITKGPMTQPRPASSTPINYF